ncbi:hypothetical protein Hanom_Chr01g00030351 [Helianthus anomalus]
MLSLVELMEHIDNFSSIKEKKKAIYVITATTCWVIWRTRNNVIFNHKYQGQLEMLKHKYQGQLEMLKQSLSYG